MMFFSCKEENQRSVKPIQGQNAEDKLLSANKKLVRSENEKIDDYINRYKWETNETGTGLRFMIYQHGNGPKAEKGNTHIINFSVSL
ncbi:MAG: hypothetical protein R2764_19660 [Bacteroidales bacterium]